MRRTSRRSASRAEERVLEGGWVLRAFFLVGPTATGKSAVAQRLAERISAGILSADSMQIYRGMDIGTAKIPPADRGGVPYSGMDLVDPNQPFSVWLYREHALTSVRADALCGRRTIVVGGSGLYVKSLVDGLDPVPVSTTEARMRWEHLCLAEGVAALGEALKALDASAYDAMPDKENPRRLIRALERAQGGCPVPQGWKGGGVPSRAPLVGLMLPTVDLHERIAQRVREMYEAGLIEEVRGLLDRYGALSETAAAAIGYAEAAAFVKGLCRFDEAMERTIVRTRQLAKRQRTWFRHQADVRWVALDKGMSVDDMADRVWKLWGEYGPTAIRG